ncbi:MAG: helix-turn-helix transcriptional regulator [Desulfovibrionaceae bacterium]|nr:helix-turn-helix transcriptional regulator [Desulfovibrionaceae bacterium]MBF0514956.1 helix-turn-helix transcriptional regulator [Desulfovibrionaceae bacterium]
MVKRVLAAIIEQPGPADDGKPLGIEEALGPSTPGAALRGYRHREALTQHELATRVGVAKQHISDMENNRRTIGKEMALRFSKALDAPWKRFL